MNRKRDILAAVDSFLAVHDRWAGDKTQPDVPTQEYELAVQNAITVCKFGEVPEDCRELIGAFEALGREWEAYSNGNWDRQQRPLNSFWAALEAAVKARAGAETPTYNPIESVTELRKQNCTDLMIAKIYGKLDKESGVYSGPFFGYNNVPRGDLIERQWRFEQGQPVERVIPEGWIHPNELLRVSAAAAHSQTRLKQIAQRQQSSGHEEQATIEEMLREGQFPAVIAKVKKVSLQEVYDVARQCDVTPNEPDGRPRPEHLGGPSGDTASEDDEPSLEQLIVEASEANSGMGAGELAAKLTADLGQQVSAAKVSAVLREHRKQAAAAT